MTAETLSRAIAALGLSVRSTFVPFSRSRHADGSWAPDAKPGHPSTYCLNWRVTILREPGDGRAPREIMATDYSQGIGHCPSYKAGARWTLGYDGSIRAECEDGRSRTLGKRHVAAPKAEDVLHSLASDASAIDYAVFEDWAADVGFDPDSRKGETAYRACLETALKLRAALGDEGLQRLRDAAAEY